MGEGRSDAIIVENMIFKLSMVLQQNRSGTGLESIWAIGMEHSQNSSRHTQLRMNSMPDIAQSTPTLRQLELLLSLASSDGIAVPARGWA